MLHLAVELVHLILENLDNHHDLISCRLISKSFEGAVAPAVWKELRVSKSQTALGSRIPFQHLATASHISNHVKKITYDTSDLKYPVPLFKDIVRSLEEFSFFPNFRHLKTLLIIFPGSDSLEPLGPLDEGDEDFDFDNYDPSDNNLVTPERKLRSAIFKKLSQIHLERGFKIDELTFWNMVPVTHTGMRANGLPGLFKSVKSLAISIVADPATSDAYTVFKNDLITLLKSASELESLTYQSDQLMGALSDAQWDSLSYPNLTYLSLDSIIFDSSSDTPNEPHKVTRFILRHKATLQELDMSSCMINVSMDDNRHTDSITWADFFHLFKNELNELKEFTFEPLPGRHDDDEDYFRGYAWWVGGVGRGEWTEYSENIWNGDDPDEGLPDAPADREALLLFHEELAQRKLKEAPK